MNIETTKSSVTFDEVIAGYGSEVLAETDIILSESAPDILHILHIDTLTHIKEKDVANDRIILRGDVNFTVLYIPDPNMTDAPVKSAKGCAHFTDVCQATGVTPDMKIQYFARVSSTDYTLINNRKINVKSTVCTEFKAIKKSERTFLSDIDSNYAESIKKEISVFRHENAETADFSVSDRIDLKSKDPHVYEILSVSATVSGNETRVLQDKCVIKGICHTNILYLNSTDMNIEFTEHEIPFTEIVDIDGISENMDADTDYTVTDIYFETEDSGDTIDNMGIEIKLSAAVTVSGEDTVTILEDCYSCDCEIAQTTGKCEVDKIFSVSSPQILIKGDVHIPQESSPILRICNISAKPIIDSVNKNDSVINLEGHLSVCILYLTADSNMPVCTMCDNILFSYSLSSDCMDEFFADCSIYLDNISYTLPSENTVSIRACTDAVIKIICREQINVIDSISVSECTPSEKTSIIIYFVQSGDNLWNIAKKYKTCADKIAVLNSVSHSAALTPGTKLLIPTS